MICGNGKNLKYLRMNNTTEILKVLTIEGPSSRSDLASRLGLSKMTITNIVTELMREGYLVEFKQCEKSTMPTTGPKPMMLRIEKNRILSIGIYISKKSVFGALIDIVNGEIYRDSAALEAKDTEEDIITKVIQIIDNIYRFDRSLNSQIIGIGVASVGLVNAERGVISRVTEFARMIDIDIKSILESRYSLPVFASNDIQASTLAEQMYGNGKNKENFIFIGISNGIGAAVVIDGRILVVSHGDTSESGHMCVNGQGAQCICENGVCFEHYTSIPVLLKKTCSSSFKELLNKIDQKDELTSKVMEGFIRAVDIELTNMANVFDPEFMMIGYEVASLNSEILKTIEKLVNIHMIQRDKKHIKIIPSKLRELGPLRGSGCLVLKELFCGDIFLDLRM